MLRSPLYQRGKPAATTSALAVRCPVDYTHPGMNGYDDLPFRENNLRISEPAVGRIRDLLRGMDTVILAIDGDSASGKSTLAAALSGMFGGGIIHMDDFFLPAPLRTQARLSEPGGNVHRERFTEEVLPALRRPDPFRYRTFDCSVMDYGADRAVQSGALRIVEGAYSLHPSFKRYYDFSLFLSIGSEKQIERIRKRNGDAAAEAFLTKWIPMEKKYQRAFSIPENAGMILRMD